MSQVVGGNFVRKTGDTMLGDLCFVPGKQTIIELSGRERLVRLEMRRIAVEQLKIKGKLPADFE